MIDNYFNNSFCQTQYEVFLIYLIKRNIWSEIIGARLKAISSTCNLEL